MATTNEDGALVTCFSLAVLEGRLEVPIMGNWNACFTLDSDTPPTGIVDIIFHREDGEVDIYLGTVLYGYPWQGRCKVVVVGGGGGLKVPELPAKNYTSLFIAVPLALIVTDIVRTAGEFLADGVAQSLIGYSVSRWARVSGGAGRSLTHVARDFELGWRVLPDGTVWMGVETWPESPLVPFDCDDDGKARILVIAPDNATYAPGTVVLGRRVNQVVYTITAHELRAELHYGVGDLTESEAEDFAEAVRAMLPELPYLGSYDAKVLSQEPDGTLTVRCEDDRIGELAAVPYRVSTPGTAVTLTPGTFVRIHFVSGAPRSYYATGVDQDRENGTASAARDGDDVDCGWIAYNPVTSSLTIATAFTPGAIPILGTITSGYSGVRYPKP